MKFTTHTNENKYIDFDLIGIENFLRDKKGLTIYSINETIATAIIDWQFYFETRSWGVKDIGAYVEEITNFEIELEYYKNESNEFEGIETETFFDLTNEIKDFEVTSERNHSQMYSIESVEIDFDTKQIIINF